MFKAQHTGDSVRVAIPYAAILDVEKSTAMDFSETIEVKVVDQVNSFEVDSYFFAYLPNLGVALEQIREAVRSHREHGGFSGGSGTKARGLSMPLPVMDTTQTPRSPAGSTIPPACLRQAAPWARRIKVHHDLRLYPDSPRSGSVHPQRRHLLHPGFCSPLQKSRSPHPITRSSRISINGGKVRSCR
jgi:sterol 3beta-glucosyltransferase